MFSEENFVDFWVGEINSIVGRNFDNESNLGRPNSKYKMSPGCALNSIQELGLDFEICW